MKTKFLKKTIFFLAAMYCISAFAQPAIKWQTVAGGSLNDGWVRVFMNTYFNRNGLALTKDKGFIAATISNSNISGEKNENSRGGFDYWVVKYKTNGTIQWSKTIGGAGDEGIGAINQTTDGGYILGGFSNSNISGEKTENSRGNYDFWIVKLDKYGSILWDKTFGGSNDDILNCIQQTNDGGYILGGFSNSNISGEKSENSRGDFDYWVIKLDADANIQWDKTIGGASDDELRSVEQVKDGGYILGGASYSNKSGEKTEYSRGAADYWIVRLDKNGLIKWDKTLGGNYQEFLYSIQQTKDGGFAGVGYSLSGISGEKTEGNRGGYDYWVIKISRNGNLEWDKTIGGSGYEYNPALQLTYDGGYIITGESSSNISGEKTENSKGGYDYWIVKLDSTHNIKWDKTIGGNLDDYLTSIKQFRPGRFLIAGLSTSGISGDKSIASRGGVDLWITKLAEPIRPYKITSVNQESNISGYKESLNTNLFLAYPNPAKEIIHVQTSVKSIVTLTDQTGKILLTKTIEGTGKINIANLPAGLYYLKNNKTGEVQKIMINK